MTHSSVATAKLTGAARKIFTPLEALENDRAFLNTIRRARKLALRGTLDQSNLDAQYGTWGSTKKLLLSHCFDDIPAEFQHNNTLNMAREEVLARGQPDTLSSETVNFYDGELESQSLPSLAVPLFEESIETHKKAQKEFGRVTRRARRMARPAYRGRQKSRSEYRMQPTAASAGNHDEGAGNENFAAGPSEPEHVLHCVQGNLQSPLCKSNQFDGSDQSYPFLTPALFKPAPSSNPISVGAAVISIPVVPNLSSSIAPRPDAAAAVPVPQSAFHIPSRRASRLPTAPPPNLSLLRAGLGGSILALSSIVAVGGGSFGSGRFGDCILPWPIRPSLVHGDAA